MMLSEDDIVEYINSYTVLVDRDLRSYEYENLKFQIDGVVHLADFADSNGEVSTVELLTVE